MSNLSALILGLVQGITEFLPISSSGHLVIVQHLLGFKEPEIFFDVCLHVGTLLAVCLFLKDDLRDMVGAVFGLLPSPKGGTLSEKYRSSTPLRLLVLVTLGTVVTVVFVLAFKHLLESLFSSVAAVGIALLITGTVLFFTRRLPDPSISASRMGIPRAIVVGFVQAIAVAPGISRSGTTISTGLFLGLEKELAVRFSFLLSIPAIIGAVVLQFGSSSLNVNPTAVIIGIVSSAVSGYGALLVLARIVRRGNLWVFAPYCWVVGLVAIIAGLS